MDFDQPPPFTEEPDRERPREEQDCITRRCTVCRKPALPGYSTCGNSYCQQIETLRNRIDNTRSKSKSKALAQEIKRIETEMSEPR